MSDQEFLNLDGQAVSQCSFICLAPKTSLYIILKYDAINYSKGNEKVLIFILYLRVIRYLKMLCCQTALTGSLHTICLLSLFFVCYPSSAISSSSVFLVPHLIHQLARQRVGLLHVIVCDVFHKLHYFSI